MSNITKYFAAIFAVFCLVIGTACDRQGKNIPTNPPTADSRLSEGWKAFETGQYTKAIDGFSAAKNRDATYADAYRGLGWSYSRVMDFTNAEINYKIFTTLVKDNPDMLNDTQAGLAAMYAAAGNYQKSIELCEDVIATNANYAFEHDGRVNAASLRALVAKCYYNQKDYLTALGTIQTYLDGTFIAGLKNSGIIVEKLNDLVKIKVAGISQTPLTGQASMTLTHQVIADGDTSIVGINLVQVLNISGTDGLAQYNVDSFNQGDNRIIFSGNPIPRNGDQFLVDYIYAPDYGLFLSKLLEKIDELEQL
jgi:tetratricopeptide (TPR) repeat protein